MQIKEMHIQLNQVPLPTQRYLNSLPPTVGEPAACWWPSAHGAPHQGRGCDASRMRDAHVPVEVRAELS